MIFFKRKRERRFIWAWRTLETSLSLCFIKIWSRFLCALFLLSIHGRCLKGTKNRFYLQIYLKPKNVFRKWKPKSKEFLQITLEFSLSKYKFIWPQKPSEFSIPFIFNFQWTITSVTQNIFLRSNEKLRNLQN